MDNILDLESGSSLLQKAVIKAFISMNIYKESFRRSENVKIYIIRLNQNILKASQDKIAKL